MKIEIVTTKRKLTKSLVNQMREASMIQLQLGTSLGYLINVRKDMHKAILIKYDEEFYVIAANWKKGSESVFRKVGRWSQSIKFDSMSQCDSWWKFYQARLKEAVNQIYV